MTVLNDPEAEPCFWVARTARFATVSEWDETPTWLTFIAEGPLVRLWAENARSFHGMRASFDGDDVRVRSLREDDRVRLTAPLEQTLEDGAEP